MKNLFAKYPTHQLISYQSLYQKLPEVLKIISDKSDLKTFYLRAEIKNLQDFDQKIIQRSYNNPALSALEFQNPFFFLALKNYIAYLQALRPVSREIETSLADLFLSPADFSSVPEPERRKAADFIIGYVKNCYLELLIERELREMREKGLNETEIKEKEADLYQKVREGKLELLIDEKGRLSFEEIEINNPKKDADEKKDSSSEQTEKSGKKMPVYRSFFPYLSFKTSIEDIIGEEKFHPGTARKRETITELAQANIAVTEITETKNVETFSAPEAQATSGILSAKVETVPEMSIQGIDENSGQILKIKLQESPEEKVFTLMPEESQNQAAQSQAETIIFEELINRSRERKKDQEENPTKPERATPENEISGPKLSTSPEIPSEIFPAVNAKESAPQTTNMEKAATGALTAENPPQTASTGVSPMPRFTRSISAQKSPMIAPTQQGSRGGPKSPADMPKKSHLPSPVIPKSPRVSEEKKQSSKTPQNTEDQRLRQRVTDQKTQRTVVKSQEKQQQRQRVTTTQSNPDRAMGWGLAGGILGSTIIPAGIIALGDNADSETAMKLIKNLIAWLH